jgi:hypothetical protein
MITFGTAGSGSSAAFAARPVVAAQQQQPSQASGAAIGRSPATQPQSEHTKNDPIESAKRFGDNMPVIAGPSPAFEASLLELEADIENVIKRVYAEREKARTGDVVKLDQEPPSPPETKIEPAAISPDPDTNGTTPYDAKAGQT